MRSCWRPSKCFLAGQRNASLATETRATQIPTGLRYACLVSLRQTACRKVTDAMPRFHGLLVVRDEADIVAQTLNHLLGWIDTVSVLDSGSNDGTWDIVVDRSKKDRRIVPVEQNTY